MYAPSATISSESTNAKYLPLAFAIPICEEIAPPEFGFTIRLNCGLSLIYSFITSTELSVLESSITNTSYESIPCLSIELKQSSKYCSLL